MSGEVNKETPVSNEDDSLFIQLEANFQEAIKALEGEPALGHFRMEYEKMYRTLKKSRDSEKALVVRCQRLTQDLLANAAKMQAAVKLSQGDHSTIGALKKEIEKAWRAVDSAKEKDSRACEMVKTLKQEIASLQGMVKDGASALTADHTSTLEQLKLDNKRLLAETDEMNGQIETCTKELAQYTATLQQLNEGKEACEIEKAKIIDRMTLVKQEYRRERNARERAEFQCKELLLNLRAKERELEDNKRRCGDVETVIATLSSQISEAQRKRQTVLQKVEAVEKQLYHTQQSYADSVDTTSNLHDRLQTIEKEVRDTQRAIMEARSDTERIQRIQDRDSKEHGRLRQQIDQLERDHSGMRHHREMIEKRIAAVRKEKTSLTEALEVLDAQRTSLEKKGVAEEAKQAAVEKLIGMEEMSQKDIEQSIQLETEVNKRLKENLRRLEKEHEAYVTELSQVSNQGISANEELKTAANQYDEARKKLEEGEQKLAAQQHKYEQVRAERNMLSKKLVDAQDEIAELRQRFKLVDHQIAQFKDELSHKQRKLHADTSKTSVAKERLSKARQLVNDNSAQFDATKEEATRVGKDIQQLVKVVHECDQSLSDQQAEFLKVSNERDLLAAQLIRRNDELNLLYEKMRLQQETVQSGEGALRDRVEDVRRLALKVKDIERQSALAYVRGKDLARSKEKLAETSRFLAVEQAKSMALAEELENPQSDARWRQVGGSDPTMEELSEKLLKLQRQLISKTEDCLRADMLLQEKQRLEMELEAMIARQPGAEVAKRLNFYHKDLAKKNAQMKLQASEVNMSNAHVAELKYEVARLRRELNERKQQYYDMKAKNASLLDDTLERNVEE